jgi:xanthine dehydrogenase accessory factor
MKDVFAAALQATQTGEKAALVTVTSTEGSTPQKAGAKMVVYADGRSVGTIGGGCVEAEMTWRARQAIEERRAQVASYELTADQAGEDGLICGGGWRSHRPRGADPLPLRRRARGPAARADDQGGGFRVEVADDRVKFATTATHEADVLVKFAAAASRMTLGPNTYAIVVTRGHKGDEEALAACLGKGLRFLGLLASRPKFVHIAAALEERGVSLEELSTIHSPLGLQLGAVTPEEIAVSVLAEMIAVRRGVAPETVKSLKMELPGRFKAVR